MVHSGPHGVDLFWQSRAAITEFGRGSDCSQDPTAAWHWDTAAAQGSGKEQVNICVTC